MKKLVKFTALAAVVLSLATAGAANARAAGWPVAVGVAGGFAAGVVVSRAVYGPPAYYAYAPRVYAAPVCAPVPVIAPCAPVFYGRGPVVYPFRGPVIHGPVFAGHRDYVVRR